MSRFRRFVVRSNGEFIADPMADDYDEMFTKDTQLARVFHRKSAAIQAWREVESKLEGVRCADLLEADIKENGEVRIYG